MQHPTTRIVAVVQSAAAVVAVILLFGRGPAALAATASVEPQFNAKTVTFTITAHVQGHDRSVGKAYVNGVAVRMDMEGDGMKQINITDAAKNVILTLDPQTKQATVIRSLNVPPGDEPPGMLQQVGKLFAPSGGELNVKREPLGEKQIDGRKLTGYRVASESENMEVWGEPTTMRPYLMVQRVTAAPGTDPMEIRWSDFKYDVKLDPSLFSTDVPAGYKVTEHVVDAAPANEANFIKALKAYTEITNGKFPDTLDAEIKVTSFARSFAPDSNTYYAGKDVRQGTTDLPVFWYKPKAATTYRIIYADFSVKDNAVPPKVAGAVRIVTTNPSPK